MSDAIVAARLEALAWIAEAASRTRIAESETGDFVMYHRTSLEGAKAILAEGFRDHRGFYLTQYETSGVWLSDVPLDANEGAKGIVLLRLHFRGDLDQFASYEWIEDQDDHGDEFKKAYREWQVPAALLSGARVEVVEDDE